MAIPGIFTNSYGGVIQPQNDNPLTERVLILGTALDGPLNTPTRIRDQRQAERIFGPAIYGGGYKDPALSLETGKANGASLPKAIAQALAAGCQDIWVVRATGTPARVSTAFSNALDIEALAPGIIYNEVSLSVAKASGVVTVKLNQPFAKGGTLVYEFPAATTTIGELVDILNNDNRNATVYLHPETYPALLGNALSTLATGTVTLTGGTCGIVGREGFITDDFAEALSTIDTGTFDILLGKRFPFDIVTIAGLHVDDMIVTNGQNGMTTVDEYTLSILSEFILWLKQVYTEVQPCHGVLGTRPTGFRSDSQVIDYVKNNLLATSPGVYSASARWMKVGPFLYNGYTVNDANGVNDLGYLVSIVAGPDCVFTHPALGNFTDNFHVAYASFLTTIKPEDSATWREVPGIKAYSGLFPAKYAEKLVQGVGFDGENDLSGKGAYVVLTQNPRNYGGPLVVFDDANMSSRNQIIRQHQLGHVMSSLHKDLSTALGGFIGHSMGNATQAAMEARAENVLSGYVKTGALVDGGFSYKIYQRGDDKSVGAVRFDGSIFIAGAIRSISLDLTARQQ